ncbi:hypothetical protein BD413DRAFT_609871 [Trametes elegans]|nr:hypothetical protein BD413DRAFT_609871 [Trametes elegans]
MAQWASHGSPMRRARASSCVFALVYAVDSGKHLSGNSPGPVHRMTQSGLLLCKTGRALDGYTLPVPAISTTTARSLAAVEARAAALWPRADDTPGTFIGIFVGIVALVVLASCAAAVRRRTRATGEDPASASRMRERHAYGAAAERMHHQAQVDHLHAVQLQENINMTVMQTTVLAPPPPAAAPGPSC